MYVVWSQSGQSGGVVLGVGMTDDEGPGAEELLLAGKRNGVLERIANCEPGSGFKGGPP